MIQLKRILLSTDFSDFSAAATKYACELATKFDSELHVLHVLETHLTASPSFTMGLDLPTYVHESKTAAEKTITSVVDAKWSGGRSVTHAVVDGVPLAEIIRYAREHEIDLIVIGTHGRTGLAHVLMGSVAENVVRSCPCPVLTVRPQGHQFVMP